MLNDLGIQLEVVKSPVSVGVENEILNIENIDSLVDYRELLVKLYPGSEKEIDEVIKRIRKIMKNMDVLYGVENPVFKDLKRDKAFLFKKLLPWLPKFIFTVRKINRMNMPVEAYLETIVKNPSLRDIISQHFFKHTPAFFAMSYFTLYLDYFYPKGGVGKLAEAIESKILAWGGEIRTRTSIVDVDATEHRVADQNGVTYKYDNLIWAADLKSFYSLTRTEGLSPSILEKFQKAKTNILSNRGGDSVFSLFLQVDEPLDSFQKIANGHFFYTPSRQGLGKTHWDELESLLNNWGEIEKNEILAWLDKFARLNTYEISIPGLKDPDLAPDGKTGLIISFLAEWDLFNKVHESGWYDEFVQELENRVIYVIGNSVYPMLKDKILRHFSFTPVSIANRIGSSEGAIVGWSFQKPVPVINKIQIADRSVLTPLPNVYQAGQWAYSPAGVPMSILTGKMAADKVIRKKRRER
jgi:phytoene dehydrogenase-like protein